MVSQCVPNSLLLETCYSQPGRTLLLYCRKKYRTALLPDRANNNKNELTSLKEIRPTEHSATALFSLSAPPFVSHRCVWGTPQPTHVWFGCSRLRGILGRCRFRMSSQLLGGAIRICAPCGSIPRTKKDINKIKIKIKINIRERHTHCSCSVPVCTQHRERTYHPHPKLRRQHSKCGRWRPCPAVQPCSTGASSTPRDPRSSCQHTRM